MAIRPTINGSARASAADASAPCRMADTTSSAISRAFRSLIATAVTARPPSRCDATAPRELWVRDPASDEGNGNSQSNFVNDVWDPHRHHRDHRAQHEHEDHDRHQLHARSESHSIHRWPSLADSRRLLFMGFLTWSRCLRASVSAGESDCASAQHISPRPPAHRSSRWRGRNSRANCLRSARAKLRRRSCFAIDPLAGTSRPVPGGLSGPHLSPPAAATTCISAPGWCSR